MDCSKQKPVKCKVLQQGPVVPTSPCHFRKFFVLHLMFILTLLILLLLLLLLSLLLLLLLSLYLGLAIKRYITGIS